MSMREKIYDDSSEQIFNRNMNMSRTSEQDSGLRKRRVNIRPHRDERSFEECKDNDKCFIDGINGSVATESMKLNSTVSSDKQEMPQYQKKNPYQYSLFFVKFIISSVFRY